MVILASQSSAAASSQATGWWEMGSRFREGGTALEPANLLIFFTVLGAIALTLWLLARCLQRDGDQPYHGPRRLFLQLCRAHQLHLLDCWLLWRLAHAHQLSQPALVFVDERHFDATTLPENWQRRQQRLGRLRARLFE